jgi:hypothetical protein
MYVKDKQREFMLVTVFGFFLKIISVMLVFIIVGGIVEVFVVSNVIFYSICFYKFSKTAGVSYIKLWTNIKKIIYIPLIWVLIALVFNFILG